MRSKQVLCIALLGAQLTGPAALHAETHRASLQCESGFVGVRVLSIDTYCTDGPCGNVGTCPGQALTCPGPGETVVFDPDFKCNSVADLDQIRRLTLSPCEDVVCGSQVELECSKWAMVFYACTTTPEVVRSVCMSIPGSVPLMCPPGALDETDKPADDIAATFTIEELPISPEVSHDIETVTDRVASDASSKAAPGAHVEADTAWIADWNFDGGAPCNPALWGVDGSWARMFQHITDNDKCAENTTCAWLFTDPALPACFPPDAFGPGAAIVRSGLDEIIVSPTVGLAMPPGADGTVLSFRLFPGNDYAHARIALNCAVRSLVGGVFTPWQRVEQFSSLSLFNWTTRVVDLSPYVDPLATDIQVRLRVGDLGPAGFGCATTPGLPCGAVAQAGPGPYLDRIRIGRRVLTGPVLSAGIDARSQAQDCFPAALNAIPPEHYSPTMDRFGTCPFSAGADEATCGTNPAILTTDAIRVRVIDAGAVGGIMAVTWYGAIVDGPHIGKAPPPYVVDGTGFFAVAPDVDGDTYSVDLDDTYFRGGDRLLYYWTAVDALADRTSLPEGISAAIFPPPSVADAEAATGGLFEVSFLPAIDWDPTYLAAIAADAHGDIDPTPAQVANSSQSNCLLYVQMIDSGRRSGDSNRTSFMYTLDRLGYRGQYDVYDVQGFGNTNNHLAGRATLAQAQGYALIVQDSGRRRTAQLPDGLELDSEKLDQAQWYRNWLANGAASATGSATLWLVGESLAFASRAHPLIATDCGLASVVDNQALQVSPDVVGQSNFTFWNGNPASFAGDEFSLDGGCAVLRNYDGAAAAGTAVITHRYTAHAMTGPGAVIMNKNAALHWNTVWMGFNWFDIRDAFNAPPNVGGGAPDVRLARKILNAALPIACVQFEDPTDTPGPQVDAPAVTALHQNVPNPFNPATTIHFDLASETETALRIYDVAGHLVRTLIDGRLPGGPHGVIWNGFDDRGRRVPSGIYFYRLVAGDFVATRRMVVMK